MSALVDRVRACVYRTFAETGRAPEPPAISDLLGETEGAVAEAIRVLDARHLLVLSQDESAIERALPFSAVPTAFRVVSGQRVWWANCVWDALAIPPLVGESATIHTECGDCATAIAVRVDRRTGPDRPDLTAHFLLPAARWYDDIRFT